MKRILACMLALALLLGCAVIAHAEEIYTVKEIRGRDLRLNHSANAYALKNGDLYQILNAEGDAITDPIYLTAQAKEDFFKVSVAEGTNVYGLVDKDGTLVMPMEYGDVVVTDAKWQLGLKLVQAETDQGDYKNTNYTTNEVTYWNVDKVDVYYCGAKIGTLTRSDYSDYGATAHGDYLQIKDRAGAYHHYSKDFKESRNHEYGEYDYDNGAYWHTGTGQQVWTASCTLSADEVKTPYTESRGYVVDLQGNQLFSHSYKYIDTFDNGIARFRNNQNKYGLVDVTGRELLPGEYDDIDYYFSRTMPYGYVAVTKDGKAGFASLNGEDTSASFLYPADALSSRGMYYSAKGMDGKYIVITPHGEIPEHFEDVSFPRSGCPLFIGLSADGTAAVYGLNGERVIENPNWDRTYDISLSYDCTTGYDSEYNQGAYTYHIYSIHYAGGAAEEPKPDEHEPEQHAEGAWVCPVCGQENNSRFCTGCGTPKPEPEPEPEPADDSWICPNCGRENTSPFCPDCGTKKPELPEGHWICPTCGVERDSLFCPEDGTKKPD